MDVTPPVLLDPERLAAFDSLPNDGFVSLRSLARDWKWAVPRVRRFLAALVKAELIAIETSKYGTRIMRLDPGTPPGTHRHTPTHHISGAAKDDSTCARHEPAHYLGSTRAWKLPRTETGTPQEDPNVLLTTTLVAQLNAGMRANKMVDGYLPVRADQYSSVKAVAAVVAARVDAEFAKQYIWTTTQTFKPTRAHSQIRSLKYLQGGLLKAWVERQQLQMRMFGVERGDATRGGKPTEIADVFRKLGLG